MKTKKLSPIGVAVAAACLTSGCSLMIPSSKRIETKHVKTGTAVASCDSSKAEALACARFLRDAFADLETSIGRGEAIYGYASVAIGALTATYMKSATDHSQAIEDLAVGVATLAGFRMVFNPVERRRIATEGRTAVECMIQSVESIEAVRAEVKDQKDAAQKAESAKTAITQATSDQTQALRELTNKRNTRAPQAEITAAEGNATDKRVTMMETLRTQGPSLTPLQRLSSGIDREFDIASLRGSNNAVPRAAVDQAELQRLAQGLLLQRQVRELASAATATDEAANSSANDQAIARRLAFGLHQVLDNARLALGNASTPSENIAVTQRDAVHTMIGELAQRVAEEQKQGERTIGAAAATVMDDDTNAAATQAAAETRAPARVQLQRVYERCTPETAT